GTPVRQPGCPRFELNLARIPGVAGSRFVPKIAEACALLYQVPGNGAPVKSRKTSVGPALPKTAEAAVQVRGSKVERIRVVGRLFRVEAEMLAANWNALRRCWPSVVPGLPPTGATGVGSLKPTPAAFPF